MGRILGGEGFVMAGAGGDQAVWKPWRGPANDAGPLAVGPLLVSIGPVIGPVNPGMFRHVLPASTADRTSYQ